MHLVLGLMVAVPIVGLSAMYIDSQVATGDAKVEEPGGKAADFDLHIFDGGLFSLGSHMRDDGRPLVLNFWASWCLPCREEMPIFDAVAEKRSDILFVGVAVNDTETTARAMANELGIDYPLGLDEDGSIVGSYPTVGIPTTWFITEDGYVAAKKLGEVDAEQLEELIGLYLGPA